jgi:hypothetical protein
MADPLLVPEHSQSVNKARAAGTIDANTGE